MPRPARPNSPRKRQRSTRVHEPPAERKSRRGLLILAVFLAALAWRIAYLARLSSSPLAGTLRGDEQVYWDWATTLIGHGFIGSNPFFQGPLYPYVLAAARMIVGSRVASVLWLQALVGAASVALLTDSARRVARPWVAGVIGGALAFYEMSVLFDGLILMESLIFFLESLLIWNWLRIPDRGASLKQFAWLGLLTGLLASARGTALLLLPATLWLANRSAGADRRRLGKFVAAVAGTCLVVVLPLTAWNYGHGGEFIPLTYNFGYNLFVGNNPDATGGFVSITGTQSIAAAPLGRSDGGVQMDGREYLRKTAGADLTPAKSSAYWTREAASFARVHPERIAELIATKILLLFNRTETPQLEIIDLFRREAGPLGVPLLGGFLFVGILGLSGLASRRLPALPGSALRLYVLGTTIGVLPFFVTDRYRYHLVPALAVLAAQGIEDLLHLRAGNSRERTRTLLFGACALILVCAPITGSGKAAAKWDQARELGTRWLDQGRPDLAVAEYERAMKLGTEYSAEVSSELNFSEKQARLHFDYAAALHRLGRSEEALSWLEAAAREDSTNARYVRTLSDAYLVDGRGREADSLNQRLRSLVGSQAEALIAEGWRAARAGLMPEAERAFRAAVSEDQRQFGAWGALIRVQVQRGEWSSADSSLAQARRAGMSQTSALVHEALIAATSGDLARARRALDAVPPGALDSDPMLRDISEAMARKIRERDRTPAVPGK